MQAILQTKLLEKLAHAMNDISESGNNVSTVLRAEFSMLQQELLESVEQLAANGNSSSSSAAKALKDPLFTPSCSKGMLSTMPDAPYSYPLIQPSGKDVVDVPYLCDTATDGGGWIIIHCRHKGDANFYRGWEEYKDGFRDLAGDFWLGNKHIHQITSSGTYELRVELVFKGQSAYAHYDHFSIADESKKYLLTIGDYNGTATDALKGHNGKRFSTFDRDNDESKSNCAQLATGAWWYGSCASSNLNGIWQPSPSNKEHRPFWSGFTNIFPHVFPGDEN